MPVGGDLAAHINLKVKGQKRRREELIFRMKRSTRLKRLMKSYCDRKSMDLNSTAFLFHGRRLRWEQTPDELEMEDGDEIDAMLHQTVHKQFIVHEERREMSAGAEEDKMSVCSNQATHINLKVKGQKRRREELIFRMKRSTRLMKLMKSYCDRKSMDLNSTAFLFHGRRLRWEQTPDELEMEDGDEIDAMVHQTVHKQFIVHEDRREMSARAEEDKMSVCSNQVTHINLKVKGQKRRREELIFRMKRTTRLKRLMKSYCDRKSVDLNSTAFLFHGRRLRWEQTPDELEMEDGDEIDAMVHQTVHKQFIVHKDRREMSAGAEEDKMPVCGDQAAHINLKVKGQKRRREELIFRMKRTTRLKRLMKSYCDRKSMDLNSTAFLFHGRFLRWEQTPDELEMEDGDEIDAMVHQTVHKQFIVHGDRREMSAGAEENKMSVCGDRAAHIILKVKGQKRRREELIFRMKRSTRLKRLMKSYCDRKSMDLNSTAFLFHGRFLRWEQTPDELEMEDGDEIVTMLPKKIH